TDVLPHRVVRTHPGATEWNPCAFVPIVRTRPCSVFGRPVHLSGLLPLITTRWFSSSLSDPASRRTPCPPKIRRWRLQVSLSVSRLSPLCLTSLSIPFHHLRPVRHYPHLWISARGLGLSGTSTGLALAGLPWVLAETDTDALAVPCCSIEQQSLDVARVRPPAHHIQ